MEGCVEGVLAEACDVGFEEGCGALGSDFSVIDASRFAGCHDLLWRVLEGHWECCEAAADQLAGNLQMHAWTDAVVAGEENCTAQRLRAVGGEYVEELDCPYERSGVRLMGEEGNEHEIRHGKGDRGDLVPGTGEVDDKMFMGSGEGSGLLDELPSANRISHRCVARKLQVGFQSKPFQAVVKCGTKPLVQ